MNQATEPHQVEFTSRSGYALITGIMIVATLYLYVMGGKTPGFYISQHGWNVMQVWHDYQANNWSEILSRSLYANFCSFNAIHMGFSLYFIWVFAGHIEQKLGSGRYLILALLGIIVPFLVLQFDSIEPLIGVTFFGPFFFLCTILGAYLVLPPQPLKKYGSGIMIHSRNEIFDRSEKEDLRANLVKNPWTYIWVFVIAQAFFHFWVVTGIVNPFNHEVLLAPFSNEFDTFRLLPCISGLITGYLAATAFVHSAAAISKEGPLAAAALKKYRELADLDVQHEEALRGTAQTIGLSYEKTRDLIARNKGKMRIK